ncbi:MAG: hypothetical protein AABX86_01865, partial [Nanoarchaeota archaeon]
MYVRGILLPEMYAYKYLLRAVEEYEEYLAIDRLKTADSCINAIKRLFPWIAVLIFLLGCSSEKVEQVTTALTGKAIAEQREAEGPFTGQTHELTFGKTYKQSTFNPGGKVLQIK